MPGNRRRLSFTGHDRREGRIFSLRDADRFAKPTTGDERGGEAPMASGVYPEVDVRLTERARRRRVRGRSARGSDQRRRVPRRPSRRHGSELPGVISVDPTSGEVRHRPAHHRGAGSFDRPRLGRRPGARGPASGRHGRSSRRLATGAKRAFDVTVGRGHRPALGHRGARPRRPGPDDLARPRLLPPRAHRPRRAPDRAA